MNTPNGNQVGPINPNNVMKRKLKLKRCDQQQLDRLNNRLKQERGVAQTTIDPKRPRLIIAYDASVQDLEHILECIRQQGCDVSDDWWTKFKISWYRSTDQTVKDNANYVPACCNKPPPEVGRK